VASAPDFPDVYPQLVALLAGRDVVANNAAFDCSLATLHQLRVMARTGEMQGELMKPDRP
jgi:DNA polymerase III epsilon subunit-like protein